MAKRMAEKTLQALLEGENGEAVREKQLPELKAKLKKQQEEEVAKANAATPPPPPQPEAPEPESPLLMALPLVPGVLGAPAEPNMVVRTMEKIQDRANRSQEATAKKAEEMAA